MSNKSKINRKIYCDICNCRSKTIYCIKHDSVTINYLCYSCYLAKSEFRDLEIHSRLDNVREPGGIGRRNGLKIH